MDIKDEIIDVIQKIRPNIPDPRIAYAMPGATYHDPHHPWPVVRSEVYTMAEYQRGLLAKLDELLAKV